jgi:hypothetical protein
MLTNGVGVTSMNILGLVQMGRSTKETQKIRIICLEASQLCFRMEQVGSRLHVLSK